MCLEGFWSWFQAWLVQTKARFRYRIDRFHAHRIRKRWLKQELKAIAMNSHYRIGDVNTYSQYAYNIHQPSHPYMPTTYVEEDSGDEGPDIPNVEQVNFQWIFIQIWVIIEYNS